MPLILAPYGHPDAGGRWEAHCEKKILAFAFVKIAEEWRSLCWHPHKRAVLLVYVDDFKLAARREHHDELWKGLRSVIDMGEESEDIRFLGCDHETFEARAKDAEFILRQRPAFVKRKVGGCPAP